jgi:hypothetical protein
MNYTSLPTDIIHHIIEFDGQMKYRYGKYMNQIPKNDERYSMLHNIKQPNKLVFNELLHYYVKLSPKVKYAILKSICDNRIIYSFYSYDSSYNGRISI